VTCDSYCLPPVNDLNSVCKKDQIDHKLQKVEPFWTLRRNDDQTKQNSQKLEPKEYLSLFFTFIMNKNQFSVYKKNKKHLLS